MIHSIYVYVNTNYYILSAGADRAPAWYSARASRSRPPSTRVPGSAPGPAWAASCGVPSRKNGADFADRRGRRTPLQKRKGAQLILRRGRAAA